MSNQYRAQMVISAHMGNNPLGINVDDMAVLFSVLSGNLSTTVTEALNT